MDERFFPATELACSPALQRALVRWRALRGRAAPCVLRRSALEETEHQLGVPLETDLLALLAGRGVALRELRTRTVRARVRHRLPEGALVFATEDDLLWCGIAGQARPWDRRARRWAAPATPFAVFLHEDDPEDGSDEPSRLDGRYGVRLFILEDGATPPAEVQVPHDKC